MNGKRIPDDLPLRTLYYGEGVFETFRFKSEMPLFFDRHVERMKKGAELLGIPLPDENHIVDMVSSAVTKSGLSDMYVKVCLVSEGNSLFYQNADESSVLIVLKDYSTENKPIKTRICSFSRNSQSPLLRIKSLNYLENILARREAIYSGYDESLFLNERGEITEGSASNIFWVRNGILFTPSIDCGVLPGIVRSILIEHASEAGLEVSEGRFDLNALLDAECAFFTNSLAGFREIARINETSMQVDNPHLSTIKRMLFGLLKWD